jgi:hypothetical protein
MLLKPNTLGFPFKLFTHGPAIGHHIAQRPVFDTAHIKQ